MKSSQPILIGDLLSKIDQELIHLLKSLSPEDWTAQTIAPKWKVKDIAVHLLDGNLRTLSMLRDKHSEETTANMDSYEALLAYLNQLNADWVKAMRRLSPRVIIDLLEQSGREYCAYIKSLPLYEKAVFSVAWAGEEESQNWFHIAREYTEKWHHQQQIRLAVGQAAELLKPKWYLPYLETSVRALPYHYRRVQGKDNDLIRFVFRGTTDKVWWLKWEEKAWQLYTESEEKATCEVVIPDAVAWRLFTKGMTRAEALVESEIVGERALGLRIFELIAVMA